MQRIAIDARAALIALIAERFPEASAEWLHTKLIVSLPIQRGRRELRAQTVIEFARAEDLHMPKIQSTIPGRKDVSVSIVEYSQVLRAKLIEREAQAAIEQLERAALEAELRSAPAAEARKPAKAASAKA